MKTNSKELAEAHWGYIEELLSTHDQGELLISKVKFHYISSFIHGYKHGVEGCEAQPHPLIPQTFRSKEDE